MGGTILNDRGINYSEGATLEKDRVYKSSEDASELVKQLVNSDRYPIAVDGQYLKRTDLSGGREA